MRTTGIYKRLTKILHRYYNNDDVNPDMSKPFLIEKHTKNIVDKITFDYVTFGMFFNNNDKFLAVIKIEFPETYPFRAPTVFINGHNYKRLLSISSKWTDFFDIDKCLCCNSILCKWGPSYNITDVLKEVVKNIEYKLRITEIKMCREIVKHKLNINYIPIEEFL